MEFVSEKFLLMVFMWMFEHTGYCVQIWKSEMSSLIEWFNNVLVCLVFSNYYTAIWQHADIHFKVLKQNGLLLNSP